LSIALTIVVIGIVYCSYCVFVFVFIFLQVGSGGKLQPLRELNVLRGTPSADSAQADRDAQVGP
jgi:hypothetical protein